MVKHFLFVWLAYWAAVLILPVESVYPAVLSAFILQFLFVVLVVAGYSWYGLVSKSHRPPLWGQYVPRDLHWMIRISVWLSLIGTMCLLYDKVIIQGIDYTQGIAVAREAWRKEGVAREGGVSSAFSVLGYMLSSGYFVAAVLLVIGGKTLNTAMRYRAVLAIFGLLILNSALAGGRTNVLLLAVFAIGAMTSVSGWSYKELFSSRFLRLMVFAFLIVSFSYLLYVFSERARVTGIDAVAYLKNFLPYLGLKLSPWFSEYTGSGVVSNIISLLVLSASYISHSFASTAAIIDHGVGDKVIVFLHPMNILYKLQLVDRPDSSWFLVGRFPSLPGALLYQFGAFGFAVISLLVGFLGGIVKYLYFSRPSSVILLSLYLMMYAVLMISPILLAVDFMSFPFVFLSFVLVCFSRGAIGFFRTIVSR